MAEPALSLDDLFREYNALNEREAQRLLLKIYKLFDDGLTRSAFAAARRNAFRNKNISASLKAAIDGIIRNFQNKTESEIINSIKYSWSLAEEKNTIVGQTFAGGLEKPVRLRGAGLPVIRGSAGALEAFIKRSEGGLKLSGRVFKLSQIFKTFINEKLSEGIRTGNSARNIAKELLSALRRPEGIANPGQGVYSNPRKNAERLTRSEINMAYASSDFERWQQQWFVIGIEVRLSNAHPRYDICDELAGKYPKDFEFPRWHPQCLCVAVPILAPQATRDKMLDFQLGDRKEKPPVKYITTLPKRAVTYFTDNAEKINGWKNEPYFLAKNPKYLNEIFGKN